MLDQAKSRGREATDDNLDQERRKTDDELAKRRADLEEDADSVVIRARARADQVVRSMRDTQDAHTPATDATQLSSAREGEDRLLAGERAIADGKLKAERQGRAQLIANLLLEERDATDGSLRTERGAGDAAIAARDDFLAMVSHDLRTLLSGIALNAAMLVHGAPPGAAGQTVIKRADSVQRFATRMTRLVEDLMDAASIEAGRLKVVVEKRDAARVVLDTVDTFEPVAASRGIALGATVPSDGLLATFDHDRIDQVLGNLVSNAIKFTDRKGRIDITVEPAGTEVRFTVRDTGRGMPPEALTAVFQRFWQASATTRHGLGLGLYISKCIVEAHGGRIWAESQVGRGSAFHFTLPRAPENLPVPNDSPAE